MKSRIRLGPFLGIQRTTDSQYIGQQHASSALNVSVRDGALRPRFGYRKVVDGAGTAYGFAHVSGYDDSYQHVAEWITVEEVADDARPFSIDPATGARTQVTDGGTEVALHKSPWQFCVFDAFAYAINPNSDPSVYRHRLGDPNSWELVTVPDPPTPPDLTNPNEITVQRTLPAPSGAPYQKVDFSELPDTSVTSDTGHMFTSHQGINAEGEPWVRVRGHGKSWTELTIELDEPLDWTHADALHWQVYPRQISTEPLGGDSFHDQLPADNHIIVYDSGGTPSAAFQAQITGSQFNASGSTYYAWADIRMLDDAIRAEVSKITIRWNSYFGNEARYCIPELYVGGLAYHDDSNYDGTPDRGLSNPSSRVIEYAAFYEEGALKSDAYISRRVPPSEHLGERYKAQFPRSGSNLLVRVPQHTGGAFTGAADIKLARYIDGDWYLLATAPNTGQLIFDDRLRDSDILADPATYPLIVLDNEIIPPPVNVFSATGVVAAVPYKASMVWLYSGGKSNVRISRIGEAEVVDESALEDDFNRSRTMNLSEDYADEPLGGVASGDVLYVVGKKAIYATAGDVPSQLVPFRRLAGSIPCAGRFGYVRYTHEGEPGMAYIDSSGEGVWWYGARQVFASQAEGRPVELTADIRGYVREFLLDAQELQASDIRMAVDEITQSLWLLAGARALILRPATGVGGRHWEPARYDMRGSKWLIGGGYYPDPGNPVCEEFADLDDFASVPRTGSDKAWSSPGNAAASDDVYSAVILDYNETSELLTGKLVGSSPPGGVITDLTLRVEAAEVTDYPGFILVDTVTLTVDGSPVGDNMGGHQLTDQDEVYEYAFDLTAVELTTEMLSEGRIGVAYGVSAPGAVTSYSVEDWNVVATPGGSPWSNSLNKTSETYECTWTVTANWIGSGPSPSFVALSITSQGYAECWDPVGPVCYWDGQGGSECASGGEWGGSVQTTKTYILSVVGGSASKSITAGGSWASSGNSCPWVMEPEFGFLCGGVNTFASGTAVSVSGLANPGMCRVDHMEMRYCHQPDVEGDAPRDSTDVAGFAFAHFAPDRHLRAITNYGDQIELEWHDGRYIEGPKRDFGFPMPAGHWRSMRYVGPNRRLATVRVDRDDVRNRIEVTCRTDRAANTRIVEDGIRHVRFPVTTQGWSHDYELAVTDEVEAIRHAEVEVYGPSSTKENT
jgi:hypothetical protein